LSFKLVFERKKVAGNHYLYYAPGLNREEHKQILLTQKDAVHLGIASYLQKKKAKGNRRKEET
jgi:hypothetical protein